MQGDIKIELYWKHAPKTCKNFTELVSNTSSLNFVSKITLGRQLALF